MSDTLALPTESEVSAAAKEASSLLDAGRFPKCLATLIRHYDARIEKAEAENARLRQRVETLTGALRRLYLGYVNTLETGRDRIVALGGDCDPVDRMEREDPVLVSARAALGGEHG